MYIWTKNVEYLSNYFGIKYTHTKIDILNTNVNIDQCVSWIPRWFMLTYTCMLQIVFIFFAFQFIKRRLAVMKMMENHDIKHAHIPEKLAIKLCV